MDLRRMYPDSLAGPDDNENAAVGWVTGLTSALAGLASICRLAYLNSWHGIAHDPWTYVGIVFILYLAFCAIVFVGAVFIAMGTGGHEAVPVGTIFGMFNPFYPIWRYAAWPMRMRRQFDIENPEHSASIVRYLESTEIKERNALISDIMSRRAELEQSESHINQILDAPEEEKGKALYPSLQSLRLVEARDRREAIRQALKTLDAQELACKQGLAEITGLCQELLAKSRGADQISKILTAAKLTSGPEERKIRERLDRQALKSGEVTSVLYEIGGQNEAAGTARIEMIQGV